MDKQTRRNEIFYEIYFQGISNTKYVNDDKGFEFYFIYFEGGVFIELMKRKNLSDKIATENIGFSHFAFLVEDKHKVHDLTEQLKTDGFVASEPRLTGNGFYESVILDIDMNRIEIVAERK